jgi:DNA-binding MarR family transcriptional regulator
VSDRLPDEEAVRPSDPTPDIDAKLAAALERSGQALRVQLWDAAKQSSLTPTQLQLVLRLAADPSAGRRVGALAAELDVTHPTVSDAVAVLRRKRLVERHGERRGSPLTLTARGRDVAARLAGWDTRLREQLAELPAESKATTLRLLLDLIAGLQRSGAITVARMCSTCRFFRPDAHPDAVERHHCALVDMPMSDSQLRVDCAEHERAAAS